MIGLVFFPTPPSPNGNNMRVICCPVETVIELPVRVYPDVVYIPEKVDDSVALIVQQAQESIDQKRMLGIVLPTTHRPTVETF